MLPRIADDMATGYGVLGGVTAAGLVAYSAGALVNGVLIQTSADLHSWRVSFLIAAVFAVVPI